MVARLSGGVRGLLFWAYEIEKTREKEVKGKESGVRKWMDKKPWLSAAGGSTVHPAPIYIAVFTT
jgi:hypothetical protein